MKRRFPKPLAQDKSIEATAAAWLAQRDDHLTPDQVAAFARWRLANPQHEAAVQRLEKTWSALLQLQDFNRESHDCPNRDVLAAPRKSQVIPFRLFATVAALAACVTLVVFWWSSGATGVSAVSQRQDFTYATVVDGYQRATLPDGSVIELNGSSEVHVHYTVQERRVRLLRGEANFVVAKNKARPFWVEAGKVSVRAVGTAFNVRLGSREVEVLVTEGKVQVNTARKNQPSAGAHAPVSPVETPLTSDDSFLVAGQHLVFSEETLAPQALVESLSSETIRDTLAWQGMRLRFVDTPLAEVAAQFNRRNHVQIEIGDASLATLPVDGSFRAENVETFVRLLESNGSIAVERVGTDRIVLHKIR